jgi:cell division protein ZapE
MAAYRALVHAGTWQRDPAQELAAEMLQILSTRLTHYAPSKRKSWAERLGFKQQIDVRQGMYIYGAVGRGKSALMDLFFNGAPIEHKRRVHFHAFMLDVHARIHVQRQRIKEGKAKTDPIPPVAAEIAEEAVLLCFDEFQVHDPADAMILSRLFSEMFERGVVVVATSNRAPDDLYLGGLNRELFLPFIDLLKTQVEVLALDSAKDYRLARLKAMPVYFSPLGSDTKTMLDEAFTNLTNGTDAAPQTLEVQGRMIIVPAAAAGIARFTFDELCRQPLGVADYIEIARQFHTLILSGIPVMAAEHRNEAKRFINLIDILYEHGVNLICSAERSPDQLYIEGHGAFEFARATSRLMEMQSEEYLAAEHQA